MNPDKDGKMREICVRQGYVPAGCLMDGFMIMAFINGGDDPCEDCLEDRGKCNGRMRAKKQSKPPR
jgi:hypothetical protein